MQEMRRSNDINITPMETDGSLSMASMTTFGSGSIAHRNAQFAGDYRPVGSTMPSYADYNTIGGGHIAPEGVGAQRFYNQNEIGGIGPVPLQLGRSNPYNVEVQKSPEVTAPYPGQAGAQQSQQQLLIGSADDRRRHHHHHHHHHLHSRPQHDHVERVSPAAVLPLHTAAGTNVQHEQAAYLKMRADHDTASAPVSRATRKASMVAAQEHGEDELEEYEEEEEDEEEGEEEERAKEMVKYVQGDQRGTQYVELQTGAQVLRGSCSYGEIGGAVAVMSGGGGSSCGGPAGGMSMMMMKKRRLTREQVRSLEVSFDRESKLEPERKNELAEELGLQPRQVAVWFQNRRARLKTKQLEREFDFLKLQYDAVRSEKDKLQAQVARLKDLLDAQLAANKGSTPAATSSDRQGKDDDFSMQHSSSQRKEMLESMDTYAGQSTQDIARSQKATASIQHDDSLPDEVHEFEAPHNSMKGALKLEVKPSLQVPHVNYHRLCQPQEEQQDKLPCTFGPPTQLSLCSPQQFFIHRMVSMKMDGHNNDSAEEKPAHSCYNQDHYNLDQVVDNEDDDYKSDSMIYFNSTWNPNA